MARELNFVDSEAKEFEEKVIQVRRVTKVVSGGKRMSFRALAVVGDRKGRVGVGMGKAREVAAAVRKAVESAKRNVISITLQGGTVSHEVLGKLGASTVLIKPAPSGHGVIAGGAVRVVLELVGVKDVVAKSIGSSTAINTSKAVILALQSLRVLDEEKQIRGVDNIDVRFVQ